MTIGTRFNVERSGNRNSLALSSSLRNIPDVRHLDLDMMQWSPDYKQLEIVFEASSTTGYKNTNVARTIAKNHGAFALLIIHKWEDVDHLYPVKITLWYPDGTRHKDCTGLEMSWQEFEQLCADIHKWYIEN